MLLRWLIGAAVLMAILGLVARAMQLAVSLVLIALAGLAAVIALILGMATRARRS